MHILMVHSVTVYQYL